jgi:hypothetical protein
MRVSDTCGVGLRVRSIDSHHSPATCFALERTCSSYLTLRLREFSRIAMSAVRTHGDVADSRHQFGALDTFPSASPCTFVGACGYLEPFAFHASMGGNFDCVICYWSAHVYCVHCDYCKCTVGRQCL